MRQAHQPSGIPSIQFRRKPRIHTALSGLCLLLSLCLSQHLSATPLAFRVPERLAELQPNPHARINGPARTQLEQIFHLAGQADYVTALEQVQSLIDKYAHHPVIVSHGLSVAAQILAQQEQIDTAIVLLNTVLQLKSLDSASLLDRQLLLARLWLQQGNYQQSLPLLEDWLAKNLEHEDRSQVHYLLAFSQYQLGRYQAAIASAEQGLAETPGDPSALLTIQFNSAFNMNAYAQSERFAAQLVQIKPQIKSYWRNWIAALSQQNKHTQALAVTEMLRQQHPFNPDEILNYVYLLLDQNLPARAARQLEASLAAGKLQDHNRHRLLLASAWQQAGELNQAIETLEALKQQDEQSLVRLISLYAETQDWPSLLRLVEAYPEQLKKTEWVQMQLVQAFYQTGQLEEAITLLLGLARSAENQAIKNKAQQWLEYL